MFKSSGIYPTEQQKHVQRETNLDNTTHFSICTEITLNQGATG